MRNNPLIFVSCAVKRPKENMARFKATTVTADTPPLEATEQKGDLLIREIWQNRNESVHDMHIVNTDASSHLANTPEKCIQEAERTKKKMYLEA